MCYGVSSDDGFFINDMKICENSDVEERNITVFDENEKESTYFTVMTFGGDS